MNRLGKDLEFMSLCPGVFEQIGRGGLTRKKQDLAARQKAANVDSSLNAVHILHDDVANNQVGLQSACALYCGGSAVDRRSVVAVEVEDFRESVSYNLLVINYQYSRFFTGLHSLSPFGVAEAELPIIADTEAENSGLVLRHVG